MKEESSQKKRGLQNQNWHVGQLKVMTFNWTVNEPIHTANEVRADVLYCLLLCRFLALIENPIERPEDIINHAEKYLSLTLSRMAYLTLWCTDNTQPLRLWCYFMHGWVFLCSMFFLQPIISECNIPSIHCCFW